MNNLLKSSFWVALSSIVTRLSGLIVLPILARQLDPTGLGLYNLVQNTVQTSDSLSRVGADVAMHRNGAQYQVLGHKAIGRLFGVGACLTIVTAGLIASSLWFYKTEIASIWLGEPRIEPWLGLIAFITIVTAIGNPSWFYMVALQAFRAYSIRTSAIAIFGAIATIILTWQFGLAGTLWGLGLTALIQAILGWWLILPILKEKGIYLRFDRFIPEARSILSFGLPFYASNFLGSFIALPLLGYVSRTGGIEQLGYLRVAQSLSQLVSFLPTAIAPVVISTLSASLAADAAEYRQVKSIHLRTLWLLILLLSTITCFSLEFLIPTLFGTNYREAILLSRLTIWITAMSSISGILSQYVISTGQTRTIALIQTIALVINVALAIWLIPNYSSIGLLAAQGIAALFTTIAYVRPALFDIASTHKPQLIWLAILSIGLAAVTFVSAFSPNMSLVAVAVSLLAACIMLFVLSLTTFTLKERSVFVAAIRKILTVSSI